MSFIQKHIKYIDNFPVLYLTKEDITLSGLNPALEEELYDKLTEMYISKEISFPWKSLYYRNKKEIMNNLHKYVPNINEKKSAPYNIYFKSSLFPLKYKNTYLNIIHDKNDYENIDILVDLFQPQEQARLTARRKDSDKSPLEEWNSPIFVKKALIETMNKYGVIDVHTLRETIYKMTKEATQFKPSLAKTIIELFDAKKVLDFSAGWGDRLIGAIASDTDIELYQAYDPNKSLKEGHDAIIQTFVPVPNKQENFIIDYVRFEDAILPDVMFDLIFTSPPFFDFEVYTDIEGQSIDSYKKLDDWLVNFLFFSLNKAWNVLKYNGHLVIHITDVYNIKVCEKMLLYIQSQLIGAKYIGVINSFGEANKARPLWVFEKTSKINKKMVKEANTEFERLYPNLYKLL